MLILSCEAFVETSNSFQFQRTGLRAACLQPSSPTEVIEVSGVKKAKIPFLFLAIYRGRCRRLQLRHRRQRPDRCITARESKDSCFFLCPSRGLSASARGLWSALGATTTMRWVASRRRTVNAAHARFLFVDRRKFRGSKTGLPTVLCAVSYEQKKWPRCWCPASGLLGLSAFVPCEKGTRWLRFDDRLLPR